MTRLASLPAAWQPQAAEFRCLHCGSLITGNPRISGVLHRNHCPLCLWSRHMDLHRPGDRLAACRSLMSPVGLTLKLSRKKYNPFTQGELMLVHRCVDCGKLSINRIAADDDPQHILNVLHQFPHLDPVAHQQLTQPDIQILGSAEQVLVQARLFGSRA